MKNKTVSYLNSKTWYRFVKVLFVIGFFIILAGFNFIVFSQGVKTIDQSQTTIYCTLGIKKVFTAQSKNINLNSSDFTDGQFNYQKSFQDDNYTVENIINGCYPKKLTVNEDVYDFQKIVELLNKYGATDYSTVGSEGTVNYLNALTSEQQKSLNADYATYKQETSNLFGNEKIPYLDFSFQMFDVTPAYTYNPFLEWFLIGNLVILFIFEVIRRIFYYIVLGTLWPRKDNVKEIEESIEIEEESPAKPRKLFK
jgi:hypothetical protein